MVHPDHRRHIREVLMHRRFAIALLLAALGVRPYAQPTALLSWNDGAAKRGILDFVARATREGSPDFVPMAERIATFDNDGTLWVEKPLPNEVYFVLARIQELAAKDPTLKTKQPFKAALEGDAAYFHENGPKAIVELLMKSHAAMSQESFDSEVAEFFRKSLHPKLQVPFPATAYRPMLELLTLLRANGFDIWICSGGTVDFMRA